MTSNSMRRPMPGKIVDGVFRRVLAADVTSGLKAQLKVVGIDLDAASQPLYEAEIWRTAISVTASALFPHDSEESARRKLGRHIVEQVKARHIVKSTWLTMARLLGPRRGLKTALEHLHVSPVRLMLKELSSRECEISTDDSEQPEFLAGLVEGAVALLGGRNVQVNVAAQSPESIRFRVHWT